MDLAEENTEGQAVVLMYWRASPDPLGEHDWYFWCPFVRRSFLQPMQLPAVPAEGKVQ